MNPRPPQHIVASVSQRADKATIAQLGQMGVATVHEAIGRRGLLDPAIRPIQTDLKLAGSAVTVLAHPGDNGMVHAAIEQCQPGDVMVIATTAPSTHGMFGDLMATSLLGRGVKALIMDAAVRDTADLREMGFAVWTRHVSCQGTVKNTPGSVNVPISIGGQLVNPGDVICADDDGVVVVARSDAAWALEQSQARLDKEAAVREKLVNGELGLDFYGLRDKLSALGVEWLTTENEDSR